MKGNHCDVLIVGGGPAGCGTALALAQAGVRVVLLDRSLAQPFRIGESATPDVAGLLERLGVHDVFTHGCHRPYQGNVSQWGRDTTTLDHFLFRGKGFGWHLDRARFDEQLRQAAANAGVQIHSGVSVEGLKPAACGWRVKVKTIGEMHTQVLVDAGGRRSPLALRLGARRLQIDKLVALATHTVHHVDLAGYSLVESTPYGWWYAVCLPDGQALVTLMTDQDVARACGFHDPRDYLNAWRQTHLLAERVPPPNELSDVQAFAAHSGCIQHAAGAGWIAVGDALLGLDPLTSSGISGALNDALAAAPVILAMLKGERQAGQGYVQRANAIFRRYLRERCQHYSTERRWSGEVFWSRRLSVRPPALPAPIASALSPVF